MTVTLRKRKQNKTGKISLYLEIYKGKSVSSTGKIKYIREYEFLNLFLVANPKTGDDKLQNKKILNFAKKIQNQKSLEYNTIRFGLEPNTDYKDTNFYEYYYSRAINIRPIFIKTVQNFAGEHLKFSDINKKNT